MPSLRLVIPLLLLTVVGQAVQPSLSDVPYGVHPRQVLDVYQPAQSGGPAPVLFFIHGGGWMTGDKSGPDFLDKCLEKGIAVVSINYRLITDANGVSPPVQVCFDDAARALQFTRSRAAKWRIDPRRIVGCGGSAGGFLALWLAFHPDMALPGDADSVKHESTRLGGVMAFVPQTTIDPLQMQAWIPNNEYGNHAFGLPSMADFVARREDLLPWINRHSPHALASSDDPPVLLFYDNPPALGRPYKDPPHSGNYGAGISEKLRAEKIEHEINYNNDHARMRWPDLFGFIVEKLKP
jgi:hypothetical protein